MLRTIFSQSGIGLGKDEKRFSRGQPSPPQRARSSRLRIWALESAWSVAGRPGLPATSWQRVFNRHFRTASSSRLHATTPGTPASSSPSPAVPPRKPDLGPMAAIFRLFGGMATLGWLIFGMAIFFGFVKQLFFPSSAVIITPPMLPQVSLVVSPSSSNAPRLPARVAQQSAAPSQVSNPAEAGRAARLARTVLLGPFVVVMAVIRAAWTLTGLPVKGVEAMWTPPTAGGVAAAAKTTAAAGAMASTPAASVAPSLTPADLLAPVKPVLDQATKAIQSLNPADVYKGAAAVIAGAGKPMRVACEALLTCSLMAAFYACCIAALSIPLWAASKVLRRSCDAKRRAAAPTKSGTSTGGAGTKPPSPPQPPATATNVAAAATAAGTAVAEPATVRAGPTCDIDMYRESRPQPASDPASVPKSTTAAKPPAPEVASDEQTDSYRNDALQLAAHELSKESAKEEGGESSEPLPPGARMLSDVLVDTNGIVTIHLPKGSRGRIIELARAAAEARRDASRAAGDVKQQQEGTPASAPSAPPPPAAGADADKQGSDSKGRAVRQGGPGRLVEFDGRRMYEREAKTIEPPRVRNPRNRPSDVYLDVLRNILASEGTSKTINKAAAADAAAGVKDGSAAPAGSTSTPGKDATSSSTSTSSSGTKAEPLAAAQASSTSEGKPGAGDRADAQSVAAHALATGSSDLPLEYSPALPWSTSGPTLSPADFQEIAQRRAAVVQKLKERAQELGKREGKEATAATDSSAAAPSAPQTAADGTSSSSAAAAAAAAPLGLVEMARLLQEKEPAAAAGAETEQPKSSSAPTSSKDSAGAAAAAAGTPTTDTSGSKAQPEGSVPEESGPKAAEQAPKQTGSRSGFLFDEARRLKRERDSARQAQNMEDVSEVVGRYIKESDEAQAARSAAMEAAEAAIKASKAANAQANALITAAASTAAPASKKAMMEAAQVAVEAAKAATAQAAVRASAAFKADEAAAQAQASAIAAAANASAPGPAAPAPSGAQSAHLAGATAVPAEPSVKKAGETQVPAAGVEETTPAPKVSAPWDSRPFRARTSMSHIPPISKPAVSETSDVIKAAAEYPAVLSREDAPKPGMGSLPTGRMPAAGPAVAGKAVAGESASQAKEDLPVETKSAAGPKPATPTEASTAAPPAVTGSDTSNISKPGTATSAAAAAAGPQIVDWSSRAYINRRKVRADDNKPACPAPAATTSPVAAAPASSVAAPSAAAPKAPAATEAAPAAPKKEGEPKRPGTPATSGNTAAVSAADKGAAAPSAVTYKDVLDLARAHSQAIKAAAASPPAVTQKDVLDLARAEMQAAAQAPPASKAVAPSAPAAPAPSKKEEPPVRVTVEVAQTNPGDTPSASSTSAPPEAGRPVRVRVEVAQAKPDQAAGPAPVSAAAAAAPVTPAAAAPVTPPVTMPVSASKDTSASAAAPAVTTDPRPAASPSATSAPPAAPTTSPAAPTSKPAGVRVVVTPGPPPAAPAPAATAQAGAVHVQVSPAPAASKAPEQPTKPADTAASSAAASNTVPGTAAPATSTSANTAASVSKAAPPTGVRVVVTPSKAGAASAAASSPAAPVGVRVVVTPGKPVATSVTVAAPASVPPAAPAAKGPTDADKDSKAAPSNPGMGPLPATLYVEGSLADLQKDARTPTDATKKAAAAPEPPVVSKPSSNNNGKSQAVVADTAPATSSKPSSNNDSKSPSSTDKEGSVVIIRTRSGVSGQKEMDVVRQWAMSTTRYLHSTVVLNNAVMNTTRASPGPTSPATNGSPANNGTPAASASAAMNGASATGASTNGASAPAADKVSKRRSRIFRRTPGSESPAKGFGSSEDE